MRRRLLPWLAVFLVLLLMAPAIALKTDLFLSELDVGPLGTERDVDAWVDRVEDVHGSRAAWLALGEVELTTRGTLAFAPLRAMFGTDLTDPSIELTLAFRPDTHGPYRYTVRQGDVVRSGKVDSRGERDQMGFMLDSVRHLFEVPWSVASIPFRRAIDAKREGRDGVFATWGSDATPTRRYDQIAIWSRAGRVERVDTTGRDVAPFIVARVDLEGELDLDGLMFSRVASVVDTKGKLVHRWELLGVRRTGSSSP